MNETAPGADAHPETARLLAAATARLAAEGARDEVLAEYIPPRRVLLIQRESTMRPLGRVWRVGPILLARDGAVYATGEITRAVDPLWPGYQSVSAERRRDYRGAAFRSRIADGDTVNHGAPRLALDEATLSGGTGPIFLREGQPLITWSASLGRAAAAELSGFLDDRISLLLAPPPGA